MRKDFLVADVKSVKDSSNQWGEFEVILSAPTLDRDGEIIDAKAFEPLPSHITFDIDHGLSVEKTVGSGIPTYEDDRLIVRGSFGRDEQSQRVRNLVDDGHIRTTSVAFMGAKREVKDGIPHIVKAELLNGAFVPVPSNREAVVLASKSFTERESEGRKAIAGSYEELREELNNAVRTAHQDVYWVYVVATFDDHVVYEVESSTGTLQFQASYERTEEGLSLGTAEEVQITEVVAPAKAADGSEAKASSNEGTDPEDAASAANPPVTGTQDEGDELALRLRAIQLTAAT